MNKYRLFFEFLGKKYQKDIKGFSQFDVEDQLREMIKIHEIRLIEAKENTEKELNNDENNPALDFLKDMFGMK